MSVEITLDKTAGTQYSTRAVDLPGGATRIESTGNQAQIQIADHHGTGTVAFDCQTGEVTRRYSDPYGNNLATATTAASGDPVWLGQNGYVGGTIDPTGYTHIGARDYNPTTGRFLSVDPIADLTDTQQLNGYAYSNNSPITFADPSGLRAGCSPSLGALCPGQDPVKQMDALHGKKKDSGVLDPNTGCDYWHGCNPPRPGGGGGLQSEPGSFITDEEKQLFSIIGNTQTGCYGTLWAACDGGSPYQFAMDWYGGIGENGTSYFSDGDWLTESLQASPQMHDIRDKIAALVDRCNCVPSDEAIDNLDLDYDLEGYGEVIDDAMNDVWAMLNDNRNADLFENPAVRFMGSFRVDASVIGIDRSTGEISIAYSIENTTDWRSASRTVGFSDGLLQNTSTGRGATWTQIVQWQETITLHAY